MKKTLVLAESSCWFSLLNRSLPVTRRLIGVPWSFAAIAMPTPSGISQWLAVRLCLYGGTFFATAYEWGLKKLTALHRSPCCSHL